MFGSRTFTSWNQASDSKPDRKGHAQEKGVCDSVASLFLTWVPVDSVAERELASHSARPVLRAGVLSDLSPWSACFVSYKEGMRTVPPRMTLL